MYNFSISNYYQSEHPPALMVVIKVHLLPKVLVIDEILYGSGTWATTGYFLQLPASSQSMAISEMVGVESAHSLCCAPLSVESFRSTARSQYRQMLS